MNILKWIESDEEALSEYRYYLGLGYSDETAQVLAAVTYGESDVAFLVSRLDSEHVIRDLYEWLRRQEDPTPRQAIRRFYREDFDRRAREMRSKRDSSAPMPKASRGGFAGLLRSITAPIGAVPDMSDDDDLDFSDLGFEDDGISETGPEVTASFAAFEEDEALADCAAPSEPFPVMHMKLSAPAAARVGGARMRRLAEALSTDAYEPIEEKGAQSVFTAPTSTFRMTTGTASMGILFNQMRSGRRVRMEQVRIEEILNYFDYDGEVPEGAKFAVTTELYDKGGDRRLLFVHAQAAAERKERQNIVLLLDTSGSMSSQSRVTQETVATIVSKLRVGDRISLVTYSTKDRTWLNGYEIRSEEDRDTLMGIVLGIEIDGCTYGSAGIETAYRIGAENYMPDGNNQVILITDGDLNFGITDKGGLKDLIEEKKKSNLFLSVIGTGLYNYQDEKLDVLAKHGNGTYCVVDSLEDVAESVDRRFIALTNIVAKDVKAQVEFNPRFVKSYRLLGYENRALKHEDFSNDAVISEPYGSGGHGVALYELEMVTDGEPASAGLRYQTPVLTDSDELGTVSIRYKEPLGEESSLIEVPIPNAVHSTRNTRLAYVLYCLAELLRESDKLDESDVMFLSAAVRSDFEEFDEPNRGKLQLMAEYCGANGYTAR